MLPPMSTQYSGGPDQSNILVYNQSPGLTPSILNPLSQTPSILSIPPSSTSTTPTPLLGPSPSTNPTSSTSNLIAPPPLHPIQTNSLLNSTNSANNNSNKPQSPFHPPPLHLPHHLTHSTSNCKFSYIFLVENDYLKATHFSFFFFLLSSTYTNRTIKIFST